MAIIPQSKYIVADSNSIRGGLYHTATLAELFKMNPNQHFKDGMLAYVSDINKYYKYDGQTKTWKPYNIATKEDVSALEKILIKIYNKVYEPETKLIMSSPASNLIEYTESTPTSAVTVSLSPSIVRDNSNIDLGKWEYLLTYQGMSIPIATGEGAPLPLNYVLENPTNNYSGYKFTFKAEDAEDSRNIYNVSQTIYFSPAIYYGVSNDKEIQSSGDFLQLDKIVTHDKLKSITIPRVTDGQYVWLCIPASMGWKINLKGDGMIYAFGWNDPITIAHTTDTYLCYRSDCDAGIRGGTRVKIILAYEDSE